MNYMQITHSVGVCSEIFMGKKIKIKPHASSDFSKKSDEKHVFFLEWPYININYTESSITQFLKKHQY